MMTRRCIEITSGILVGVRYHTAAGVDFDHTDFGRRHFTVDAVEADGGRISLWDGTDYAAAILAAEEASRAERVPVRDLVAGGADG